MSGPDREGLVGRPVRKPSGSAGGNWLDAMAPVPWAATAGLHGHRRRAAPLYTPEERARRDSTVWTLVQGILAPVQFIVCLISAGLVIHWLDTGEHYLQATVSVLVKTALLYTIMITGSVWEKVVFGKWLFARPFFWEDVVSMGVIALHTLYVAALIYNWGTPHDRMILALVAYGIYAVNAVQFLLKLRAARMESQMPSGRAVMGGAR